jgi:hypothetical protein
MSEWKLESGPKIPDSSFQIAIRTGLEISAEGKSRATQHSIGFVYHKNALLFF